MSDKHSVMRQPVALVGLLSLLGIASSSLVCLNQPCAPQNLVADFVFVVDTSNAFEPDEFEKVRSFLSDLTGRLTIGPTAAQVAIYSYALSAKSTGPLSSLGSADAVSAAIQALEYQGSEERDLAAALAVEASEISEANGLRNATRVITFVIGDAWTGDDITPFVAALRPKYDLILVVGAGVQPVDNAFEASRELTGVDGNIFFAFDVEQLSYASLWVTEHSCPGVHVETTLPPPTSVPSAPPDVGCDLSALSYDIFLIVDTSTAIAPSEFDALRSLLVNLVSPFPVDLGSVQFGLLTTASDTQIFYTGMHDGQTRADVLTALGHVVQDPSPGQALQLTLKAIEKKFLMQNSPAQNKVAIYFTDNTNWDADPSPLAKTLFDQYGLNILAVRWGEGASNIDLSSIAGGSSCVLDAAVSSLRDELPTKLDRTLCRKFFCRV